MRAGANLDKRGDEGGGSALYAPISSRRTDMVKLQLDTFAKFEYVRRHERSDLCDLGSSRERISGAGLSVTCIGYH
jgi:hypothetical protein